MKNHFLKKISPVLLLLLSLYSEVPLKAQDATTPAAPAGETAPSAGSTAPAPVALPPPVPSVAPTQVDAPSVTLPTPALPPPVALPTPMPDATPQPLPIPEATPEAPVFNPPTAQSQNLPSAAPPGATAFTPASTAMPDMTSLTSQSPGAGALGGFFDWAKKLRFQLALRSGYDSNVNSVHTNVTGSWYGNLNGGVNYRFGDPRLDINASITGGLTSYPNLESEKLQGQVGFGLGVEYRYKPRLIFTFNSSSSYQSQPNASLVGTAGNSTSPYIYTANSFGVSYQINDLWTSISRLNFTSNYYLENALNNQQGFSQPGFTQSFRYLYKPTTTLVIDYNSDYYGYDTANNHSWGNSLVAGFDHTFNPKLFWNFRAGAEFRTYQNDIRGSGVYIGPSLDNNVNYAFGKNSSIGWLSHIGTEPSGQQNVSYAATLRTGLNYNQGITAKLRFDIGLFYLLSNYQDNPVGVNNAPITYNQSNLQGNVDVIYQLNRIIDCSIGYQYLTTYSPAVPLQEYNRGISYLQVRAGF